MYAEKEEYIWQYYGSNIEIIAITEISEVSCQYLFCEGERAESLIVMVCEVLLNKMYLCCLMVNC
jgi:hypothetical protein